MHKTTHRLSIKGNAKLRTSKTLRILALTIVTLTGGIFPARLSAQSACYSWSNQTPIQNVVDQYSCVDVVPGSYSITEEVTVRNGGTVTINGNGSTFTAIRPSVAHGETSTAWREEPLWANRSMFRSALGSRLVMNNATLDGSNIVSYLVTAKNDSSRYSIDRMTLKNGACSAVGIFSNGITITNSFMVHNGHNCKVFSGIREAAAIYSEKQHNGYHFSPIITGNTITDSYGPALDINGAWGGTFSNNRVYGNTEWAAVSLYGASYWKLTGNSISHPANSSVQNYHPYCQPTGGPIGNRSAAIFLCQDSGIAPYLTNFNLIENNNVSSGYGILLVGSDETLPWMAPRVNTIRNNNVIGSLYGCADDLKINQWFDANTWSGNNCAGVPNTGPHRF